MQQNRWSSRFAFILAATGAAIGLGNIWKFPYMAGDYGGSAFVLLYVLCVALIGLPAMMAEILLGKLGRHNPIQTMTLLAQQGKHSPKWAWVGWIGALSLLMVLSFYSVISGWSIAYVGYAASGTFQNTSAEGIYQLWSNLMQNPGLLVALHTVFLCLTLGVVVRGVKNGIEKASKIMLPILFLTVFILMLYGITQGDAKAGFHFLFRFDISRIDGTIFAAALGHAFFTLAIGAGAMLVYGAYIPNNVRIVRSIVTIAFLDVCVAFMSGMAIFPLVFKHGLTPEGGPGLMFKVLPIALMGMPFGRWIGMLFFALLLFAAWASSLSMAEPLILTLMEKARVSRLKAACIVGLLAWSFGLLAVFSFNILSDVQIFGRYGIFQIMTDIPTNLLLPLGGLGFTLFAGYCIPKAVSVAGLNTSARLGTIWYTLTRYVAPVGIFIVLVGLLFF
jgi:NSS family neurotransmitter:Na+ symporter